MAPIVKPVADAYAFNYLQTDSNETYVVDVEMVRDEDKERWEEFVNSRLLNYYVGPFATPHVRCYLSKIKVFYLTFVENVLDGAFVEVTVVNTSGGDETDNSAHVTPLFLRCPVAAVLIVLRTHTQETDGSVRPREFVVMVQENRRNISQGYRDVPEIPYGRFDQQRHVRGPLVSVVESVCDIQLLDVDFTRLNGRRGVASMPGCSLDNVELYLFRKSVSEETINELRKKTEANDDKPGTISVKIIPLGQAWQVTNDLKTLGAIFYFHELRYLNRMPRYLPPSGGRRSGTQRPTEPVAPIWTPVKDLEPTSTSFNLLAKVHKPLEITTPPEGSRNARRVGIVEIGDGSGYVTLVVTEKQLELPGLDKVGTPLVLRNASVDMSSRSIRLYVSQQWGDLLTDLTGQEGLPSSDFEVNSSNNISDTKYEVTFDRGDSSGSQRSRPADRPAGQQRMRRAGLALRSRGLRRAARGRAIGRERAAVAINA
eukprot:Protomagalhaensia_wolfi_Nauph_80__2540@NODE_26_length_4698_cov_90_735351_g21_i0_p1_GENE_NODE_26_length_4698_cov_90_735351_g21_i0NODE_26_length_4698_cov_90_735351_g21_i0_p1_ORF_typecomplete_len484_score75_14_NODE_26_length_4698_cov_90_735351_g21_i01541605